MQRREGIDKLAGREKYVDDVSIPGHWWGATVRSPVARGVIREIRFGTEVDWSEFTIVDHRDVPGHNEVALIENDQPILAAEAVRHRHEPVLLLAHPDRDRVRAARRAIEIVVDEQPAIFDATAVPTADVIQHGPDNVFKHIRIDKGDVERALASAPRVIEGTYHTGAQEHIYLENQGVIAEVVDGVIEVRGSMQCPYYIHAALKHGFATEDDGVRVVQTATGGGFGGKEEYPSQLAAHAALLAMKSGRPVKLIYDRSEDIAVTTKRHPAWVRHRTGVTEDGQLLAQDVEVVMDGGAYLTLSPVVLSRGVLHASGPYACDHVRVDGRVMLTNSVPFGAFRGFGAPQTIFATERHLDVVAEELGICAVELRRRNLLRDGESTSTGQVIRDDVDRVRVLDRALSESRYYERQELHATFNRSHAYLRRGIGLATFYHGAGFTGSGETTLDSRIEVAGRADGTVELRTANVEMGQGALTTFVTVASEALGYPPDWIDVAEVDTARVPNSGPTVASRTAMIVGRLVERGAEALSRRFSEAGSDEASPLRGSSLRDAVRGWYEEHPDEELIVTVRYEPPPGIEWDEETYRGSAYGAYAWATYVAEVEVDLRTCGTRLLDFVAVQDVGTVLDETLARGQIQGGVVQGVGWALMEECRFREGAMENHTLTNYSIPSADDVPPIRVVFFETPYEHGARGAKGIGELPMDGGAPAIINAIARATGCAARTVPLTPERLASLVDA